MTTPPPGGWARCNFDGRPLSPGDMRKAADFRAYLAARKDHPGLQWLELADADGEAGPYWRAWYCQVPPLSCAWRVVSGREEWAGPGPDGLQTRHIYEIELAQGEPHA